MEKSTKMAVGVGALTLALTGLAVYLARKMLKLRGFMSEKLGGRRFRHKVCRFAGFVQGAFYERYIFCFCTFTFVIFMCVSRFKR